MIGSLLGALVDRDDLVIATKARLRPGTGRRPDTSRGHLLRTLHASLRRLGTHHVDLWQVPGHDPATPLEETLSAMDIAVSSGRVRYAGGSILSGWQTARAATWQAAVPGRAPSTPGWSAASNGKCCRPAPASASACCPGRRSAAAC